ncbi:MAG: mechanosensitive ion channel family protein [Fuerstiella sp.]
MIRLATYGLMIHLATLPLAAQQLPIPPDSETTEAAEATAETPQEVSVAEVVDDEEIDARLQRILAATEWFRDESVDVRNGVVFLTGITDDEQYRTWAGNLARSTEDVVAVVNRIQVAEPPIFDLSPAFTTVQDIARTVVRSLPLLFIALLLLSLTWFAARAGQRVADWTVLKRIRTGLLREVARKTVAIPIFLLGIFLVLKVTGLTQLAVTVLGGTGLFGLVIGFAFRDIAENFLASILLSVQNPFRYGDLIRIGDHFGFVQRVNTRGTLLMTLDGNHVQIPNADIYKGTIVNYTSNPNQRFQFTVGVGYDVETSRAQEVAVQVLRDHPAVLDDPEPMVLVEQLASSTVNLTVYAWINGAQNSLLKVKSSVMRLTLRAFEEAGFSMPDDQREIVFPEGIPIRQQETEEATDSDAVRPKAEATRDTATHASKADEEVLNDAEGDFSSEAEVVRKQAEQSRDPDDGSTDLLSNGASRNRSPETEQAA